MTDADLDEARRHLATEVPVLADTGGERGKTARIDLTPTHSAATASDRPGLVMNLLERPVVVRLNRLLWLIDLADTFPELSLTRPLSADAGPAARRLRQDVAELTALVSQGRIASPEELDRHLRNIFD